MESDRKADVTIIFFNISLRQFVTIRGLIVYYVDMLS